MEVKLTVTVPLELEYVDDSDAYKNFINSVDSEVTKSNYRTTFSFFMKYCKITSYLEMTQINRAKLEGLIRDYIIYLREDKKLAPGSIATYLAPITHFYEMNDVVINWKKIKKFKGRTRSVIDDQPYTSEQIKTLLECASLRDQCIILLMASAGLRRGAVPFLKIKDLQKIDKYNTYRISVYKKEQEQYTTFCTPECAKHIDKYLDYRQRLGEKLKPTSPLFRTVFDLVTEIHVVKPITKYIVSTMANTLLERSGLRMRSGYHFKRSELMQTHGFRKFFKTTCINAGMNPLYSEYLMGHRSGLTKSYFKPSDMELLEGNDKALGYVAVINDLTINEEHRLTKKVNELQLKNDQIMELERQHRKELESIQNQMNQIFTMIRQNPKLAKIKPQALINKKLET